MASQVLAVVSVVGSDQKGVVARFATFLAERGVNIIDIEQRVVRGMFIMDMLVDLKDLSVDLAALMTGLLETGKQIDMEVRVALHGERKPKNLVILASKEEHCLIELLERIQHHKIYAKVAAVIANHPSLEPIAKTYGVPFECTPSDSIDQHFKQLGQRLSQLNPDCVALARYMRILPAEIVGKFTHRIINIHPSLLPYFPGAAPYRQAYDSGVRVSGCTAHFVTEQLDQGPVILQDVFHIDVGGDTLDDVKLKGVSLEARTLAEAVRLFVDDELVVVGGNVIFKPGVSRFRKQTGA
jgi:formyltetrahydrofolate deformylase